MSAEDKKTSKKVLVAVDGSAAATKAFHEALCFVKPEDLLLILSVINKPSDEDKITEIIQNYATIAQQKGVRRVNQLLLLNSTIDNNQTKKLNYETIKVLDKDPREAICDMVDDQKGNYFV